MPARSKPPVVDWRIPVIMLGKRCRDMTIAITGYRAGTLIENPFFNAIWFDLVWFCLVVGQERLMPASLALLAFHLLAVASRAWEWRRLAVLAGVGIAVDIALTMMGIFVFEEAWLIPWWLLCLWVAFAATLSRSLAFLAKRQWLAVVTGAIAGPISYWAGYKLGAVAFGWPVSTTLLLLAVIWAGLLPLLLKLANDTLPLTRPAS